MKGKGLFEMEQWLQGCLPINPSINRIRNFFIWKFGPACSECGWIGRNPFSGRYVVELDHIDGNRSNNTPGNFRLLCPNCHAMTQTYKALNRGDQKDTFGPCRPILEDWE